jgi:hypothetical protein
MRARRAAHKGDSGFVLIQVIAFSIVLAMITFALVSMSISEYATANAADQGMRAFYIADAGAERAIGVLRADSNWNDGLGADKNANNTSWQPLYDSFQAGGAGNAVNQTYPSGGGSGSGTYSIYVKRPAAGSGYNPANTIWFRVIGKAGPATRSIEVLLHRLTPLDFSVYSAQSYTVANGGGNVTLHGSAYFYQDLGLKAVKTGIYNDRQILSGDLPPYTNQVYVKGTLDMSTGNSTIGTASQQMYGVHAGKLNLKNNGTQNLYTLELDNIIPSIPYPNVSGYITSLLTNKTYGNALTVSQAQLVICTGSGPLYGVQRDRRHLREHLFLRADPDKRRVHRRAVDLRQLHADLGSVPVGPPHSQLRAAEHAGVHPWRGGHQPDREVLWDRHPRRAEHEWAHRPEHEQRADPGFQPRELQQRPEPLRVSEPHDDAADRPTGVRRRRQRQHAGIREHVRPGAGYRDHRRRQRDEHVHLDQQGERLWRRDHRAARHHAESRLLPDAQHPPVHPGAGLHCGHVQHHDAGRCLAVARIDELTERGSVAERA